jgi:tetratricopeptide (TPR) repeat protein
MNRAERRRLAKTEAAKGPATALDAAAQSGLDALAAGQPDLARSILTEIVRRAPSHGAAHHGLGLVAKAAGDLSLAARHLQRAVSARPSDLPARLNYASVLLESGRLDEARLQFDRILREKPDWPVALRNMTIALLGAGKADEAAEVVARGLALAPEDAQLWFQFGNVSRALDRHGDALEAYERASELDPGNFDAAMFLALEYQMLEMQDRAEAALRRALSLQSDHPVALIRLAAALVEQGRAQEALPPLEAALPALADTPDAHVTAGWIYRVLGRLDEAEAAWHRAATLDPEGEGAFVNLAVLAMDRRRFDEARALLDKVLARDPDRAPAALAEAYLLMLQGDFERGWPRLESRLALRATRFRAASGRRWEGEPLEGRTLLVEAEEGYGDSLQFLRYVPRLVAQAKQVALRVPRALVELCRCSFPDTIVVPHDGELPAFDCRIEMMSLPLRFGTVLDAVPAAIPYLVPPPGSIDAWRERLGDAAGPKIGLVWAGNPNHRNDYNRSMAVECLLPLLAVPGLRPFSLQVGPRAQDLERLPSGAIADLAPFLDDFGETAAALSALDLVIAVDTATAHLAGALGRPVWLLLPYAPDWRWMLDREDSPWYPSFRLFRQSSPRDWDEVVARVAAALREEITAA